MLYRCCLIFTISDRVFRLYSFIYRCPSRIGSAHCRGEMRARYFVDEEYGLAKC